jgi:uncharacterized membrane protein
MTHARLVPGLLAALAGLPCAAQTTPVFTDLGAISNVTQSQAMGVSPDGNVVVGHASITGTPQLRAYRWTRQTGLTSLGVLPGGSTSVALDASSANIVGQSGTSSGPRAFRWAPPTMVNMGVLPGMSSSQALGVSDDGSVIVGICDALTTVKPFRWTAAAGMVDLAQEMGLTTTIAHANDVSGDGLSVVGTFTPNPSQPALYRAYRWNGTFTDLGLLPGSDRATATAANRDGWVIVGQCFDGGGFRGFRWTQQNGIADLGSLPGATTTTVSDVSADGLTVVGGCGVPGGSRAWVWTQDRGMQDLNTVLPAMGINLGALTLTNARAVDLDATVIVGDATDGVEQRGWVLDMRGDSDGDGLKDHWEITGIPYINDAGQARRLILPGANPGHKDLYLEIDCMSSVSISQEAIDLVIAAFAAAPLANPNGVNGVTLHVLKDEPDLAHIPVWQTDGCWPADYDTYYNPHFGTDAERAANGGTGHLFRTARSLAYRYCIVADYAQPFSVGGCGGTPGDKTVLFLGGLGGAQVPAAVLMHELGHNLGLDHGGGDDRNGKPNYPSIMNYVLSYPALWNNAFWRLDYSRAGALQMGNLNESSLDETVGIGTAGGEYSNFLMPFGVSTTGGGREIRYANLDGRPIDFGSATGTMIPDGELTTGVVQDLNYLPSPPPGISLPGTASPGILLEAHNDWAAIVLATPQAIGPNAPAPAYPTDELTAEAVAWIAQNFPIPGGGPPPCYANCDGSSTTPVLNVADFTCFLQRFAAGDTYANCDNSTTAPTLNVADFTCFLQQFAAGCP